MHHKKALILSLLILPAVLLITPLVAQSNPTDLDEVVHMKADHQKVEGVVSEVKIGSLYGQDIYRSHAHFD